MIISRSIAIDKLDDLWPSFRPMMADARFWLPAKQEVRDLVWNTYIDRYKYTLELFDCDDFALVLHAFVVQERYRLMQERKLTHEQRLPWAFGQAWGRRFRGERTHHAINICITRDEGVILIEPQNDQIWTADPDNDDVYFVRM